MWKLHDLAQANRKNKMSQRHNLIMGSGCQAHLYMCNKSLGANEDTKTSQTLHKQVIKTYQIWIPTLVFDRLACYFIMGMGNILHPIKLNNHCKYGSLWNCITLEWAFCDFSNLLMTTSNWSKLVYQMKSVSSPCLGKNCMAGLMCIVLSFIAVFVGLSLSLN